VQRLSTSWWGTQNPATSLGEGLNATIIAPMASPRATLIPLSGTRYRLANSATSDPPSASKQQVDSEEGPSFALSEENHSAIIEQL